MTPGAFDASVFTPARVPIASRGLRHDPVSARFTVPQCHRLMRAIKMINNSALGYRYA